MKLSTLFTEETVLVHSEGECFEDFIRGMLGGLFSGRSESEIELVLTEIVSAEMAHPSLTDEGVCIPYLRSESIGKFGVAMASPERPVAHPANPESEIKAIFLILAPQHDNTLLVQTAAAISRCLASKTFLASLKGLRSPGRVIRLIEESGVDVKTTLVASDIMEPIATPLKLDTLLHEAVFALAEARDEGLPVFDDKDRLVGEITTREVLLMGMPKYLDLLSNPDMLNAFEPFENYFSNEHTTRVRDICRRDLPIVRPNTPIVQVAHQMIAESKRRVYVVHEDRVEGIIYRKSILVKIMSK